MKTFTNMKRSEIWLVDFEPTVGAEIRKIRPAIIVNSDAVGILALKVVVPITDWKTHYSAASWLVRLEPTARNGLMKVSAADTFQVQSAAYERFIRQLGEITDTEMTAIANALKIVLMIK